jgi:uncharacterized Zn finger protein
VTLNAEGEVEAALCTCQYSGTGDCKHIVAVLLTYLNTPEQFEERAPIETILAERSHEQLIALIRQMIALHPDLEALIERPVPGQQSGAEPINTDAFRRELRRAFHAHYEWDDHTAEEAIYSVADTARRFELAGDWRSAAAIYRTILTEGLAEDVAAIDDEGEFVIALDSVVEAVAACLEHDAIAHDDAERRVLLDQLLDVFIWNVDEGGIGLGEIVLPEALLAHAEPEDLPALRERIQAAQRRAAHQVYAEWHVEAYESLLVHLDAIDNTDPEVTLQRLRDLELYDLLAGKLLELGRGEEAVAVVVEYITDPHGRLRILPALSEAGQDAAAIQLAVATLTDRYDGNLAYWLGQRYTARGDRQALLDLRLLCMQQQPSEQSYTELKQAAAALGVWKEVRPEVIRRLKESKQLDILTRVYLHDEDWDAAWDTLSRMPQRTTMGGFAPVALDLEVAERSRHARPERAIPVYVDHARNQIAQRTRGHYAQAAEYVTVVRDLYLELGDEEAWLSLIEGIRAEFPRLRALQDELNQAGL